MKTIHYGLVEIMFLNSKKNREIGYKVDGYFILQNLENMTTIMPNSM